MKDTAPEFVAWLHRAADLVLEGSHVSPWSGPVWRCHARRHLADDAGGSLLFHGRYHRTPDLRTDEPGWPVLYTACSQTVALGEIVRNTLPSNQIKLSDYALSELHVDLARVFVAHDAARDSVDSLLGLDFARECMGTDYRNTQELARLVRESTEAMLVPSCTRRPEGSLIIFPDLLDHRSAIQVTSSLDLALIEQAAK